MFSLKPVGQTTKFSASLLPASTCFPNPLGKHKLWCLNQAISIQLRSNLSTPSSLNSAWERLVNFFFNLEAAFLENGNRAKKPSSLTPLWFSSVQFSHSVVSDSLQPHESQHARPPCPSPSAGVHSNSCPSRVSDAIQPSHPLSSPFPPAPNPSQHQSLFQ